MAHETPQTGLTAQDTGITAPAVSQDAANNPSRRRFLGLAATAAMTTAIGLAAPGGLINPEAVFGSQRHPDHTLHLTERQLTARGREVTKHMQAHSEHTERRLARLAVTPETTAGIQPISSFKAGDKVDAVSKPDDGKVIILRGDDGWYQGPLEQYFGAIDDLNAPVTFLAIQPSVTAFPGSYKDADKLKDAKGNRLVQWGNHGVTHNAFDTMTPDQIIFNELFPQRRALEDTLGRQIDSLVMGPPYGAGALPGDQPTSSIKNAAKRDNEGVFGWALDTLSYNGLSVNKIVNRVLNGARGNMVIITHPVEDSTNGVSNEVAAMKIWIPALRDRGFKFAPLSNYANRNVGA